MPSRRPGNRRRLRRRPPWLAEGRRVIGVELQGHGHTPDTVRTMSIERFADDVAELIDRVAGGAPVDVWGFSLEALMATSLVLRHPTKVGRLVLASSNIRPDGYHPAITAPEQDDPRLPTEEEFAAWHADYEAVAPNPGGRAAAAWRDDLHGLRVALARRPFWRPRIDVTVP